MEKSKSMAKSKKYRQIIETARDLFMRHGIRRVSVEEICQTAGVSKMTFYKYFENKIDLAIFILKEIYHEGEERYKDIMAQGIPYSEKAKEIIKMKLEKSEDVSQEMFKDLIQSSIPEVAEFLQRKTQENLKIFLDDLVSAQKRGEIRKDINPQFILYFLNLMPEMAVDERLLNLFESPKALTAELINFFFYGILTTKSEEE